MIKSLLARASLVSAFPRGWLIVLGILALDLVLGAASWFRAPLRELSKCVHWPLFYLYLRLMLLWLPALWPALKKHSLWPERFLLGLEAFALFICTTTVATCCIYLLASFRMPFADTLLSGADALLGFHWPDALRLLESHPAWMPPLKAAYGSILWQAALIILFFSLQGKRNELAETYLQLTLTLCMASALFFFLPALGPASLHGLEDALFRLHPGMKAVISDLRLLHAGESPDFAKRGMTGIVSFPSFHTAASLIYAYSYRRQLWAALPMAGFNLVMLASIPVFGNHYLTDMLGGAALAALAIWLCRKVSI